MIGHDLAGRASSLTNALVVADEWWIYTMYYVSLNCPRLDCPTVFALASEPEDREALARFFPGRDWYDVKLRNGALTIVRGEP